VDPNGGHCTPSAAQRPQSKEGCNIDPSGRCVTKAGCNVDPSGRCLP
jgi:hypothetical protein